MAAEHLQSRLLHQMRRLIWSLSGEQREQAMSSLWNEPDEPGRCGSGRTQPV